MNYLFSLCLIKCIIVYNRFYVYGIINVNVTKLANNYVVHMAINDVFYKQIVDTGSGEVITYDGTETQYVDSNDNVCETLILDNTILTFNTKCQSNITNIEILTAKAFNVTTISSKHISIQNNKLHQWQNASGDLGLSYCYSNDCNNNLTPFQELVQDASNGSNLIFGLDFRSNEDILYNKYIDDLNNPLIMNISSMQLGNIKSEFTSTINWLEQSDNTPTYHQFMIENFMFCNNFLLGNFSMNWLVMVDTGSSCLTLPKEIYDSFISWFNNDINYRNIYELPALEFNLALNNSSTFYIPLSDLVINTTDIKNEKGAPFVTINNIPYRLCILQGDPITSGSKTNDYYSNPPSIIFGALTLQSIYFAGDYTLKSIGISNKLSVDYINKLNNNNKYGCNNIDLCGNDQVYVPSLNTCKDFTCSKYFFTYSNHDTNDCEYKSSTMIGALIFILLIVMMEIISYFSIQYCAGLISVHERNNDQNLDIITKYFGRITITFIDFLIIHVLKWIPNRWNDQVIPAATANRNNIHMNIDEVYAHNNFGENNRNR